ncbi:hypothetical protein [Amycolatopsis pigmentata]|uniref:Uncharacterized protein n=1 Tax=Amycolatopsis pigmentata TaxID=450801 RepID=A0ABW5G3N6_9PSEU
MATRITDAQRYVRGDRVYGGLIHLAAVTVVVIAGTVAGMVAADWGPHLPVGLRVLAGIGAAIATTGLITFAPKGGV